MWQLDIHIVQLCFQDAVCPAHREDGQYVKMNTEPMFLERVNMPDNSHVHVSCLAYSLLGTSSARTLQRVENSWTI